MVRELKDLMQDALPQQVREPDLDAIETRVARRHTVRLAGAAAGVIGAMALGVGVLANVSGPDTPIIDQAPTPTVVEEGTAAPSESPSVAPTEAAPTVAGPFTLETMSPMPAEGVAVSTRAGIAFVDLDGTLHGTLVGYELPYHERHQRTPGLVLAARLGEGTGTWIAPGQAASLSFARGVPLGWESVMVAGNEPGTWLLEDFDGETHLVSDDAGWWLSADHRTITWVDPAGTRRLLDFDMGGTGTAKDGCFSSDEFADLNSIDVCRTADGSWLEVFDAGVGELRRIDAPVIEGEPSSFIRAYFSRAGVVASVLRGESIRTVGFTREGEPVDVLGPELAGERNVELLGVSRTGDPIVRVPSDTGGVFLLDETGPSRLWDDGSQPVQVWTGLTDLAGIRERLDGGATSPEATSGRLVLITDVDVERRQVTVDEQEWLSGEEARVVYEDETGDPSGPPNDYLLRDVDGLEGRFEVVDGATVLVPGDLPETVAGDLDDVATWIDRTGPFLAWVDEAEPGRLGAIRWQYTP